MTRLLLAAALGVFLGFAAAHYQQLGLWTLIPWGVAGLAVGSAPPRGRALLAGALYGFVLAFVFMMAAYTGASPLRTRLPGFALLGCFGALCGLLLSVVGQALRTRIVSSRLQAKS